MGVWGTTDDNDISDRDVEDEADDDVEDEATELDAFRDSTGQRL